MSPGFAATNSFVYWQTEPARLVGLRRSRLPGTPLTEMPAVTLHLPGFHCPRCRLLLLDYSRSGKTDPP